MKTISLKTFIALICIAATAWASLFFYNKKESDEKFKRNNPADPDGINYQGYMTTNATQQIIVLNSEAISNGITRIAIISNVGWRPKLYATSLSYNFKNTEWSDMNADRIINITLPDSTGWHTFWVSFHLYNNNIIVLSNSLYYKSPHSLTSQGVWDNSIWNQAIFN